MGETRIPEGPSLRFVARLGSPLCATHCSWGEIAQPQYQSKGRVRVLQLDRFVETESVRSSVKTPIAVDSW